MNTRPYASPPILPSKSRFSPLLLSFLAAIAFLVLSTEAHAVFGKKGIDYSSYDVPVYEQIINRIQDKISARLGHGPNSRDRFFIIPFAYENDGNDPEYSHSFLTVIHVFADGKRGVRTPELTTRTHKRWRFEAFTISWLPHDFLENPNLCVFNGTGSRLFATRNKCPISVGKDFNLQQTIKLGANVKNAIAMWGPYEITKDGFDLAVKRLRLLDTGTIKYRADDRLYRKDRVAINCFHAIAGLDQLFPNGGLFGTGFKMWGLNGTSRVLIEYKSKAQLTGALLEPVDVKKDRYGFVYAPDRSGRGVYNPFKNASAYRR